MMWTPDAAIEEARRLPGWGDFHAVCGRAGLSFDIPNRERRRGAFTVVAVHHEKTARGYWRTFESARATGKSLIDTMKQAHDDSGRATPETTALLARMMAPPVAESDPLEEMFG